MVAGNVSFNQRSLSIVLNQVTVSDEILLTAIAEVEALLIDSEPFLVGACEPKLGSKVVEDFPSFGVSILVSLAEGVRPASDRAS